MILAVMLLASSLVAAAPDADRRSDEIRVSWDFGPRPGNPPPTERRLGTRTIPVRYKDAECRSRFTLKESRIELGPIQDAFGVKRDGEPVLYFTLVKHAPGKIRYLPLIAVFQNKVYASGEVASKPERAVFPERRTKMAVGVRDWSQAEIEFRVGWPFGVSTYIDHPIEWQAIEVSCH